LRAEETHLMNTEILNTTIAISAEETLNAIVARYPEALPVLQRFGLDTCCGGALPLRTAAQHHDLDPDELIAALNAAVEAERR
jgi:regulator of cell morphogenesis and NO signaling